MSTARIAVVVPTRNAERTLHRCLTSVRAQVRPDGSAMPVTLVVVDNGSSDATVAVARSLAHAVTDTGPERSAQRNAGTRLARQVAPSTEAVLFIDADMVLEPTVCAEALDAVDGCRSRGRSAAVVIPETSFGEGFWARCRALERRIAEGDPRTEAARAFDVAVLDAVGGWAEDLTAGEDWDLTDRVVAAGAVTGRTTARVHHDEGRPTLRRIFAKKRYYGRWIGPYLARRSGATSVSGGWTRLGPLRVLRRPGMLLARPHVGAGLVLLKTVDALGVAIGALGARPFRPAGSAPSSGPAPSGAIPEPAPSAIPGPIPGPAPAS